MLPGYTVNDDYYSKKTILKFDELMENQAAHTVTDFPLIYLQDFTLLYLADNKM